MRHTLLYYILLALSLTACVGEDEYSDTREGNFEALWRIMDEHYCFFSEKKQQLGVDWDEVHARYLAQVQPTLGREQLFEVFGKMIGELRDGHVNLTAPFDLARNWTWREDYPTNLSDTLLRRYLSTDYRLTCGLSYRRLTDNVGYLRCPTFENDFGEGNLDEIMLYLAPCQGLIIDVRSNSGGMLTSAEKLARRFTNKEITVGYICHKRGPGHDDFSPREPQRLTPPTRLRWQKPVVVLTNRSVFSAANEFVKYMRECGATIIGDRTGGGAGLPFSSELPNGWAVRFSACPMYDAQGRSTEDGIAPDIAIALSPADILRGRDTIIEAARAWIAKFSAHGAAR